VAGAAEQRRIGCAHGSRGQLRVRQSRRLSGGEGGESEQADGDSFRPICIKTNRIRKGRPVTSELGVMRACAAARRRPAVADGST
ncbi:MAG TPA: hypothetical protein VHY76_11570, partial [Acetobacteraceae bacterium]|nr:hypothetical protein [Acetobacteraceae bacterium]